jgi:uncharacterized protein (DUF1499 family)|tara:strand:- start:16 stop:288 length:273 start_codon:yes stop_codon:yes gene_type:complete
MAISKKRAPHISADNLERVLSQVYDDLNEVIDSVNQSSSVEEKKTYAGKTGDMRVIQDQGDKKYYLEMKSDDGWVRSDSTSTSGFSLNDK